MIGAQGFQQAGVLAKIKVAFKHILTANSTYTSSHQTESEAEYGRVAAYLEQMKHVKDLELIQQETIQVSGLNHGALASSCFDRAVYD